jgi:hypothetical protein
MRDRIAYATSRARRLFGNMVVEAAFVCIGGIFGAFVGVLLANLANSVFGTEVPAIGAAIVGGVVFVFVGYRNRR